MKTDRNKEIAEPRRNWPDWVLVGGTALEIKTNVSAVREIRDALVQATIVLADEPKTRACILMVNPRLTRDSITIEFERFRATLRPSIADRLDMAVIDRGEQVAGKKLTKALRAHIRQHVVLEMEHLTPLPKPDLRSEVLKVLLHNFFTGKGPVGPYDLAKTVGCGYRVVARVLDTLKSAAERSSDRRVMLKHFPDDSWRKILALAPRVRATRLYTDRSGQPRSVESLVRRLASLGRPDLAVGGILGAKRFYPNLDIVGTPRLDVIVHAPESPVDLDFVRSLDPALALSDTQGEPVRLAVHFLRRKQPFFDHQQDLQWADAVECLADLSEMRLEAQAHVFLDFLISRAKELSRAD